MIFGLQKKSRNLCRFGKRINICMTWLYYVNPFDAEARMLSENLGNTMAVVDALAPCVTRSSAAILLIMQNEWISFSMDKISISSVLRNERNSKFMLMFPQFNICSVMVCIPFGSSFKPSATDICNVFHHTFNVAGKSPGALLLMWFNFYPNMDKSSYAQ